VGNAASRTTSSSFTGSVHHPAHPGGAVDDSINTCLPGSDGNELKVLQPTMTGRPTEANVAAHDAWVASLPAVTEEVPESGRHTSGMHGSWNSYDGFGSDGNGLVEVCGRGWDEFGDIEADGADYVFGVDNHYRIPDGAEIRYS
jgi:hypothetical protein